jgi:hypothetical protein
MSGKMSKSLYIFYWHKMVCVTFSTKMEGEGDDNLYDNIQIL